LTRIRTAVAVLAIALPITVAVAGCGGGSSSNNEDPQKVLDETFNNPTKITSGNLDVSVDGSAQGDQSGDFSASISGPFQTSSDQTSLPELDLTANVSASGGGPSLSFDGSLIATKDNAYVEYQNQAYEVGTDTFKQFATAYAQAAKQNQSKSGSNAFSQFGIDPSTWLTNVTNEGTTSVEGADAIQIHGDADVGQIVSDLQKISQQTGGATTPQITPQQLDQLKSSVQNASIDVYSGADDHLLRKLALSLSITPPSSTGASVSSVDLNFSVTLSDVNQPQTITAPSNAKPLSDLLSQFGLPGLPGVGGTGGLPIPGASGSGSSGGGANPAYFKCVQQAGSDPAKVSACASKLQ
jgi:hypothetical protein